jgi:signal peptidase I
VLLVLILCFGVFIGYGLVDNRWYHVLTVEGGSMEPTIGWGDLIVITKPPEELKPGMIVTMQVKDKIVTHRVLQVDPLITQGDANGAPDAWESEDVRVVGVVRFSVPSLGRLLDTIHLAGLGSNAWFRDSDRMSAEVSAGHWEVVEEDAISLMDVEMTPLAEGQKTEETPEVGTGGDSSFTSDVFGGPKETTAPPGGEMPSLTGVTTETTVTPGTATSSTTTTATSTTTTTVLDPVEPSPEGSLPTVEGAGTETTLATP